MATRSRARLTPEQRDERRRQQLDQLRQATSALLTSEGWQRWLRTRSRFHRYSLRNTLLIAFQCPHATHVAGFRKWLELGRCVRKGEKAIRIFAPVRYRRRDEDEPSDADQAPQLALALLRYLRSPKRRLLAPDGLAAPLPGSHQDGGAVALELPVRRILRDGLVELAGGGHSLLVEAHGTSFELRSPIEQQAFVDCFARFLNSRREPLQLVVRSEPANLDAHADTLTATTLPDELAAAAAEHADHLRELARSVRLRRRRIILVLTSREADPADARPRLQRQAAEAEQILAGAQVALRSLDGVEAAALLAAALDPPGPPAGSHLEGVIHAKAPTP